MKKRLYLPIETKNREFDAKVLLACAAAESGYTVVLGYKKCMLKSLETLPPGIFFDKSMPYEKRNLFAHYRKFGHKLVAHDEEGLAPFSLEEYQRRRQYCNESLESCEYMLAWGNYQAAFMAEKAPLHAHRIIATGHPRVDLTRKELRHFYQPEVEQLRAQYGRMVLFNTNFSFGNHFFGEGGFVNALERAGKIRDEAHRQFYIGLQQHQERLFDEFVALIITLHTRFPDLTLLVRPHPSENHDRWQEVLPQHARIVVKHEGNVLPWLLAADVVIHNSCTTGVEAYLLDRPVVAYLPVRAPAFEGELSNKLAEWAINQNEAIQAIDRIVNQHLPIEPEAEKDRLIREHVTGLDGDLACDRIVAVLDSIAAPSRTVGNMGYYAYHRLKRLRGTLSGQRVFGAAAEPEAEQPAAGKHKHQKFPGVELCEVQETLQQYQDLLGRFSAIHVAQLQRDLFRLSSGEVVHA